MPLRRQMRSAISRANGSMLEVMGLEVLGLEILGLEVMVSSSTARGFRLQVPLSGDIAESRAIG
jgi:hypothetical protein